MKRKLKINSLFLIIYQIFVIIAGLIIPRMILSHYGSNVNGLTYSISQMLSVITYFDFGVSSVAQAALYRPINEKNNKKISEVYAAVKRYFNTLTVFLLIYILFLCLYYALFQKEHFSWLFTTALILAIALSSIGQNVWGVSNQVLLAADQKIYIYTGLNIITVIGNAVATYILISLDCSIQLVKLVSSMIFLIRPIVLQIYVKKNYSIEYVEKIPPNALPGKWSGLIQHVAATLTSSLDTIILTLVSTLANISIYNVYVFPLNGVKTLVEGVGASYKSFFGNILTHKNNEETMKQFDEFEILIHMLGTVFLAGSIKMLAPFIEIYTKGVNDADYNQKLFGILITIAYFIMIIRIPYTTIVNSAGHFRETQKYSIVEVILNLMLSFILVYHFGLIGVAIGTIIAVGYRLIALVIYLKHTILFRSPLKFILNSLGDAFSITVFICLCFKWNFSCDGYLEWFGTSLMAIILIEICWLTVNCMINKMFRDFIYKIKFIKKYERKNKN